MTAAYELAADAVLLLHLAFVLFVVGGEGAILLGWWRGWRWTRGLIWRVTHLCAIALVAFEGVLDIVCPLTLYENALRRHAGQVAYATGFVADWAHRLLFYSAPPWIFTALYGAFAALVAATFLMYPPRRARECKRGTNRAE